MHCKKYFTDYYKKLYEIWRQRNPDFRINTDAKKLINQEKYTMQNKKITELETEEIKKDLQESQTSNLSKSEKEHLEQMCILSNDEQEQNSAPIIQQM